MFKYSLLLLSLLTGFSLHSQELLTTVPIAAARLMTTDELGNVYIVTQDNALIRFSENGERTGSFRSIQNGNLQWVDASNPLRILLSYPQYSKLLLLDNMLAPKQELDLKKLQIFNMPAAGSSADGKLWVYDYNQSQLRKIDDQLQIVGGSNDLRMETGEAPQPQSLIEQEGRVYLCDSARGIFIFDRFGNYQSSLSLKGITRLQLLGSQLLYFDGNQIQVYDTKSLRSGILPLPQSDGLLDARVGRNRLFLLYADKLEIYNNQ